MGTSICASAAPQPEPEPFDEATSTAPNFFDDAERNEEFADTMAYLINELRKEWKRDIARMERRINKAISEAKKSDDDHVVDLPAGGGAMLRSGRRVLVAPAWAYARQQFAVLAAERDALAAELAEVRRERDEFRTCLRELQCAVQERWAAEQRIAELHRERAIGRARAAERDPAAPLQ